MRQKIFYKKKLGFIAAILILIGIVLTTILVKSGVLFQSNAGPGSIPTNTQTTNISDTSFTISYTTADSVIGTINIGQSPTNLEEIVLDDRDNLSQTVNKYNDHSISPNNLEPNKKYFYSITSGNKIILNNGKPFEIKTGPVINSAPISQIPITGRVNNPDGSTPTDGTVIVKIDGAQILSTYLKNDGNYTVPLNTIRKSNLDEYFKVSENTKIFIEIFSNNLKSQIEISGDQISPVPFTTLSKNYNSENKIDTQEIKSSKSAGFRDFVFPTKLRNRQ